MSTQIKFIHTPNYDDFEDRDTYTERTSFTKLPHPMGLVLHTINDGASDLGEDMSGTAGFTFTEEEAKTLLEFLKRHYGD